MHLDEFKASLAGAAPPAGLHLPGQALWWLAKGDWHRAHRCCQDSHNEHGAWVHAHLHRVEGDERNAAGWYQRAGKTPSEAAHDADWEEIARATLSV